MPRMIRCAVLAAMTVIFCSLLVGADEKGKVPEVNAQKQAEKLIKDVFKADYAKAKLPADKSALAEKLLAQAIETKDDPAARFVLFREARDLAAEAGVMTTCFKAVDAIAKGYSIDVLAMKTDALTLAAKSSPLPSRKVVAEMALAMTDEALAADNYDAATRLATVALTAARSGANTTQTQQATLRVKEVEEVKGAYESLKTALATLKDKPADAEANTAVGKFLCLMKGEWEKGVPMLALGKDPELKRLAEMELAKPTDAKDKSGVGDGWWDLADKLSTGIAKTQLLRRAGHWYRQCAPGLTGLSKTKVEKRITDLDKLGLTAAGVRKPGEEVEFPLPGDLKMTFCWIPPGTAQLGSPKAERDAAIKAGDKPDEVADEDEQKRGQYTTRGFWLGKYPASQVEWEALTGNNPSHFKASGGGAAKVKGLNTSRFPVENVSWNDCQGFLKKLNALEGVEQVFGKAGKFALPHEDEWEYACRGGLGNKQAFYWGNELNGTQANNLGSFPFGTATKGPTLGRPTAVGSYATKFPHPWGLCDLHGNLWEWCENLYGENNSRARRGGSWGSIGPHCRAARRGSYVPGPGILNTHSGVRILLREE